jgi:hypothetical protein
MSQAGGWPELTFPEAEADCVRQAYRDARVILEYGSGGSTVFAARQPGKLVFSVESDRGWALELQRTIDDADLPSETVLYHVDIGTTGRWGRPKNADAWRHFHRYPTSIWSEPFFRSPDTILVDGRLRPACLVNSCLSASQPITILFDDYGTRPMYHVDETLVKPAYMAGRMAVFKVTPQEWPKWSEDLLMELCTMVSFEADDVDYSKVPDISFLQDAISH